MILYDILFLTLNILLIVVGFQRNLGTMWASHQAIIKHQYFVE